MLNGQNCNVLIKAPDIFHKLLSLTLSGWTYKQPIVDDYFELCVSLHNGKYHITSNLAYVPTPRSDLVDTFKRNTSLPLLPADSKKPRWFPHSLCRL